MTHLQKLLRKLCLVLCATLLLALPVQAKKSIEVEASIFDGTLYSLSYALSEMFKSYAPEIELVPVETSGNAAGIVKASANPATCLVAGSALPLQEAIQGTPPFAQKYPTFRFVAGLRVHVQTLITLDPKITTLADLSGKRVGLGPQPNMLGRTMWSIMRDAIPGSETMKPFWMNWNSLKDGMIDGSLDCMVLGVGIVPEGPWSPVPVYQELVASRGNPTLISMDAKAMANAAKRDGFIYPPHEIPANAFAPGVPDKPILAWSEQLGYYAFEELPEDVAYTVIKILYEHASEMTKYTAEARGTWPDVVVPPKEMPDSLIHPGSLRYLKEKGLR